MADPTNSTCAICMDSLWSGEPMGAYVPCGHVFHVHCGEGWRESRRFDCRCPLCNTKTSAFCRIFIDTVEIEADEEDSILTEDEEVDIDDDNPGNDADSEKLGNLPQARGPSSTMIRIEADEDDLVLQEKACPMQVSSAKTTDMYKKKIKNLKRQLTVLSSKHDKAVSNLQELRDSCQDSHRQIEQLTSEKTDLESIKHRQQLVIEGIRLAEVQLTRKVNELQQALSEATRRAEDAETSLKIARHDHERQIHRESKNRMTEVERIIADNKRMQQDLMRLKEHNQRLKAHLESEKSNSSEFGHGPASVHALVASRITKRPKEIVKQLLQMDPVKQRDRRTDGLNPSESTKLCQGKVSEIAVRMARASEKPAGNRSVPSAGFILDRSLQTAVIKDKDKRKAGKVKELSTCSSAKRIKEGSGSAVWSTFTHRRN